MICVDRSQLETPAAHHKLLAVVLGLALLGCSDDGVPLDDANSADATSGADGGGAVSGGTFTTTGGTNGGVTDGGPAATTGNDTAPNEGGESDGERDGDSTSDASDDGSDGDPPDDDGTGAGLTTGDPTGSDDGCTSNDDCDAQAYCDFPDEQCGGGSSGDCELRPEQCLEIDAPVCGCDGQSYPNACLAASVGIDVASDGPCS